MLGLNTIGKKIFGTPNDRKVKKVQSLVAKINALEPEFQALSDAGCLLYTSPSPRDKRQSRMPSSA